MEKKDKLLMNLVLISAEISCCVSVSSLSSDDELLDSSSNVEPIGNGVGKLNLKRGMSLLIQGGGGLDMY